MTNKHHLKDKLQNQDHAQHPHAEKPQPPETPVDETSAELETLIQERDEWKNKALHIAADMENLRKRVAIDLEKNTKYANTSFAKDLLPIADGLDKAIDHAQTQIKETDNLDPFLKNLLTGVEMVQKQLNAAFKKHTIEKMQSLNTIFDPNYHQVISQVDDSSKPTGTIVQEMQSGYMIGDRVLREAMVIVTK